MTKRQSLPTAVTDTGPCNGCTAMKATVAGLQTTLAALQATVAALDKRVDDLITRNSTTPLTKERVGALNFDRYLRTQFTYEYCRIICGHK